MVNKMSVSSLPSKSVFVKMFFEHFEHVKFLKKTTLGRCDFCMSIPVQKQKITNDLELQAFKEACKQHQELHTRERLLYINHTHTLFTQPEKVLHMVFDCSNSYDLPLIVSITKESANLAKVCVAAVSTINHTSKA
jgi:hypothetical protein